MSITLRCARCHQVLEYSTWGEATGHALVDVRPCGCPPMETKAEEPARLGAALADQAALPTVEGLADAMADLLKRQPPYRLTMPLDEWTQAKQKGALKQFTVDSQPCPECGLMPWENPATRTCACGRLVMRP